jgi:hypothetical protein
VPRPGDGPRPAGQPRAHFPALVEREAEADRGNRGKGEGRQARGRALALHRGKGEREETDDDEIDVGEDPVRELDELHDLRQRGDQAGRKDQEQQGAADAEQADRQPAVGGREKAPVEHSAEQRPEQRQNRQLGLDIGHHQVV